MRKYCIKAHQNWIKALLRSLFILALTIYYLPAVGQSNGRHIELQGESVTRIFKDSRNLMWIGTSNGLLCYDGELQIRFKTDDCRRPQNFVNDICELTDGSIIVGMRNGLYRADFPSESCIRVADELTGITSVENLGSDDKRRGNVMAVGCQQGLILLDGNLFTTLKTIRLNPSNVASPDNSISSICFDGKQTVWACNNQILMAYNLANGQIKNDTLPESLISSSVNDIQVKDDQLYIATTNNGLLCYSPTNGSCMRIDSIPPSIKQISLVDNTLFVCTDGGGVYIMSDKGISKLPSLSNSVYSCLFDKSSSTLWCGYYQQGFSYSTKRKELFSTYKYKDFSTDGMFVRSFLRHDTQTLIGTRDGIYLVDEERDCVRHYTPEEIQGSIIMDIKYFAGQYIVANYEHGLCAIDPTTMLLKSLPIDKRHQESSCSRLAVSPDGKYLYVASSVGLIVLDKELQMVEEYNDRHSDIISTYIYDIMFDKTGKLWVSTLKGLCLFNPSNKRFQSSGFPKGFFNNVPNITFCQGRDGNILAVSEQTLYRCSADLAQVKEYPLHQDWGLGYISFIEQIDIKGKPYQLIGTNCGLFVADMDFQSFHQYTQHDDIPSPQFQRFNAHVDDDGTLWMANAKGLVVCAKENRNDLHRIVDTKVYIDRYFIDRKEHLTDPFATNNKAISLGWFFGTDELVISPMLLDYSIYQDQRYYEWTLDNGETHLCYNDNPITVKDMGIGVHHISIALSGHPETKIEVEVLVMPSPEFYGMTFGIISLIVMVIMIAMILKRRRLLHEALKQKHKVELELATRDAVRQHIQQQELAQAKVEEDKRQEKADKLRYKSSEYKELKAKVKAYMEKEKPYLNKDLRITEVATKVGSNAGTLSLMFNDYMNTNYFDFVNHYRIDHFKKLALDPEYAQYTVLAISEMCGLKRSSFFNVFKKFEGCTPSEWIKKKKEPNNKV